MQSSFKLDMFEPKELKNVNIKLDKKMLSMHSAKEINDGYRKGALKESLWQKILRFFK